MQEYEELKDIIAILGVDELTDDQKQVVGRARKLEMFLTQPMFVAARFTNIPGKYVKIEDTIKGCKSILDGECDELSDLSLYMIGSVEEGFEKEEQSKKDQAA